MFGLSIGQKRRWKNGGDFIVEAMGKELCIIRYEETGEETVGITHLIENSDEVKPEPKLKQIFAFVDNNNEYFGLFKDGVTPLDDGSSNLTRKEIVVKDGKLFIEE